MVHIQWRSVLQVSEMHKKGITCLSGLMISPTKAMFVSTSSDALICTWELIFPSSMSGKATLKADLSFSNGY